MTISDRAMANRSTVPWKRYVFARQAALRSPVNIIASRENSRENHVSKSMLTN